MPHYSVLARLYRCQTGRFRSARIHEQNDKHNMVLRFMLRTSGILDDIANVVDALNVNGAPAMVNIVYDTNIEK